MTSEGEVNHKHKNKELWPIKRPLVFIYCFHICQNTIFVIISNCNSNIVIIVYHPKNFGLKMVTSISINVSIMMKIQKRENNDSLFLIILLVLITLPFQSILLNFTTYFPYYDALGIHYNK